MRIKTIKSFTNLFLELLSSEFRVLQFVPKKNTRNQLAIDTLKTGKMDGLWTDERILACMSVCSYWTDELINKHNTDI